MPFTQPAVGFAGSVSQPGTIIAVTGDTVGPNAAIKNYGPKQVSNYTSFQFFLDTQSGVGSSFGFLRVTFIWTIDAQGLLPFWQEDYVLKSDNARQYHFVGSGPIRSSYLTVRILNCDHAATATYTLNVQGGNRSYANTRIREKAPPFFGPNGGLMVDQVLAAYSTTLGPGLNSANLDVRFYHGPATLDILSTGQAAAKTVQFTVSPEPNDEFNGAGGPGSYNFFDPNGAGVHTDTIASIDLPRRACKIVVHNGDANTITYFVMIVASEW